MRRFVGTVCVTGLFGLTTLACGGDSSTAGDADGSTGEDGAAANRDSGGGELTLRPSTATVCGDPTVIHDERQTLSSNAIALTGGSVYVVFGLDDYEAWHYSENSTGEWVQNHATSPLQRGWAFDMAADSSGMLHVSFMGGLGTPRYAVNSEWPWPTETIDESTGNGAGGTRLHVDDDGSAHVVHVFDSNTRIQYATNASGSWVSQPVASGEQLVAPSLAMDAEGNIHVAFLDNAKQRLAYATNQTGQWNVTELDPDPYGGDSTAIDIGPDGKVLIAYAKGYIKLVDPNLGQIRVFEIPNDSTVDMVLDDNGAVHLVVGAIAGETGSTTLRYLTNADGESDGDFGYLDIDQGSGGSLAVQDSEIHLSYASNRQTRYAKACL